MIGQPLDVAKTFGYTTAMPDTIRPGSVVPASVTIAAIADQTTLDPATLDSTVSGGTAPYTYSWTVNGVTTGIADATAADTTFTPTAAGRMAVALTVTDGLGATGSASRSFLVGTAALSVSIAAVSDQLTLAAITLDSTVTGGVGSKTYAWTVNGATTGLSNSTAADPTFTPTGGGKYVAVCTVTDAAGQTATASVSYTVGDADGKVQRHHADWTAAGSAVDFSGATTSKTIDGLQYDRHKPGTVNSFAATEGVGLSIDPNSADAGVKIAGNALSIGMETDAVYYAALAAGTLNNDGDQVSLVISCASGDWATAYAVRSGGVQRIGTYTSTGQRDEPTAGGGQVRQMALRVRGYQVEVYYSETALSGSFLALSEMTKASSAPAGFFTMSTLMHGGASVDRRVPASDTVWWIVPIASTDAVVITNTEIRY